MKGCFRFAFLVLFLLFGFAFHSFSAEAAPVVTEGGSGFPWWAWPLLLFIVTFVLGIIAMLGGVGGGVLFVPIVGVFFFL